MKVKMFPVINMAATGARGRLIYYDLVNGFVLHDLPHFICDPHLSYLSVRFDTHNRQ